MRSAQAFSLDHLSPGQYGVVTRLCASGPMRRRLLDLGLIPGTRVQCVLFSPAGDPVAFEIRGAVIALRSEDSREVLITPQAPCV